MTTSATPPNSISEIYAHHPLSAAAILHRIRLESPERGAICEEDLAYDPRYGITDQNHVGGAEFVLAMGKRAGVARGVKVLDLGSGLGGPARLLAQQFHAQVTGIEASEGRYEDAQLLTRLTRIHGVHFRQGDFWSLPVEENTYDVLWGQAAWNHVRNKLEFLQRWLPALRRGGRVACEDVFLRDAVRLTLKQRRELDCLRQIWQVEFLSLRQWFLMFSDLGLEVVAFEDLSAETEAYCRHTAEITRNWPDWPEPERTGLEIAATLISQRVQGYFRAVVRQT